MRVYIAGPYTKGDTCLNVRAAIIAGDKIAQMGFFPFIPHLTHFWGMLCPGSYDYWMTQDFAWLSVCDCIYRLPGESAGADAEEVYAQDLGIPVFTKLEELVEYDKAMSNWMMDGGHTNA